MTPRHRPPQALRLTSALFLALASSGAPAARPFVTDDARIVDRGGCQIESFVKRDNSGRGEFWFLPACNPLGRVELTAGGLRERSASETDSVSILQAKTLLKPLEMNGAGFALTLGALRRNSSAGPAYWSPFLNAIASRSFAEDRWVLHANAGVLDERSGHRALHTWGVGAEIALTGQLYAILETYGQELEPQSRQLGVRYWIIPNRFQVDSTLGWQHAASWLSVGVRILF